MKRTGQFLALGLCLLAVACLATVAQAQTVVDNSGVPSGTDTWSGTGGGVLSQPFTVSNSADVLVLDLGYRTSAGTKNLSNVTYGGQAMNLAIQQVSVNSTLEYADIYYLYNPPKGANTLTVTFPGNQGDGTTDEYAANAFTLSGVDTSIAPIVSGNDSTTGVMTNATTVNVATPLSFAAIINSYRGTPTGPYTFGPAGTTLWSFNANNLTLFGGGYAANLPPGPNTITSTITAAPQGNRNEIATALFAPLFNTWTGANTNVWNVNTDQNWSGPGSVFQNGTAVKFPEGAANPNITIGAGGVLPSGVDFTNNTTAYTFSGGAIGGSAGVLLQGTGLVTFLNANTYTGVTTINGGTLQIGTGGSIASTNAVNIASGAALLFNHSDAQSLPAPISGGGQVIKAGAGTLTLGPAISPYTGGTVINQGTLVAPGGVMGYAPVYVGPGATLSVSAAGSVGLTSLYFQSGAGLPSQNNNNPNYYSLTALQSHVASLGAPQAAVITPVLNVGDHGTYVPTGGTVTSPDIQGAPFPAPFTANASNFEGYLTGMVNITTAGTYNFGTASDDGSVMWIDGQMVVNNNSYQGFNFNGNYPLNPPPVTGSVTLAAGLHSIVLGYYQGGGGYSFDALVNGPDTGGNWADLGAAGGPALTPDLVTGSLIGSGNVNLATGSLIFGADGTNQTFSGPISGPGGLFKVGAGVQTLTGVSTYTGATTVGGGTLQIGGGGTTGSIDSTSGVSLSNGTIAFNRSNAVSFAQTISGAGGLAQNGAGTLTLNSLNTYYGPSSINAGKVIAAGTALGVGTVNVAAGGQLTVAAAANPVGHVSQYYNYPPQWTAAYQGLTTAVQANSALLDTMTPALTTFAFTNGVGDQTTAFNYPYNQFMYPYNTPAGNAGGGGFGGYGDFYVRWTGPITIPTSGFYTFYTGSDDGSMLGIDGKTVVMNNYAQGVTERSGSIYLTAGMHAMTTIYNEGGGGYSMYADIASADGTIPKENIPASMLQSNGLYLGGLQGAGNVDLAGNLLMAGWNDANSTFSGVISDSVGGGTFFKAGNGTLTLAGANTYSGTTNVSGGTLQIGNGGTTGSIASPNVISNSMLAYNRSDNVTLSAAVSGIGGIAQVAPSVLTLTGNNTITGMSVVSGGTMQIGNGGSTGSIGGGVTLANGALILNRSDNSSATTVGGPISGVGTLTKVGAGTATIAGDSTFSGPTTINQGTLKLAAPPTFEYYRITVTANGGDGYNQISEMHYYLNGVWTAATNGTLTPVDNGAGTEQYWGNANDNNENTKLGQGNGNGSLPYTLTYDFGSPVTFNAYNWATANDTPTGTRSPHEWIIQGSNDDSTWTTIDNRTASDQGTGPLATFTWAGANPNNYQVFNGAANGGAANAWTLGGALPSTSTIIIASGAKLDLNGNVSAGESLVDGTGGGGVVTNSNSTAAMLTLSPTGVSAFSGVIQGGAGIGAISLALSGTGTQILTHANTYTGSTTINTGTLQLGDGTSGHDGSIANTTSVTNNGALVYNLFGNQTASYPIMGTGTVSKAGAGRLSLTGGLTTTGATYITGGTLALSNLQLPQGMYEGIVSNNGTGQASIANGYPTVPHQSIQQLARWGNSTSVINGTPAPAGANVFPYWGDNTTIGYTGYIDVTNPAGATYDFGKNFDDNAYLVIDGNVIISNTAWNDTTSGTQFNYGVALTPGLHTFDLRFGQGGGGAGPNTGQYNNNGMGYNSDGNTTAVSTDWLEFGVSDANTQFVFSTIQGPLQSQVVMSSNTTLDLSGTNANGTVVGLGSLTDAASGATGHKVFLGGNTLDTGFDNTSTTFSGNIYGAGGLMKDGTGTMVLAGTSQYTGTTMVNNGILQIGNGGATGSVNSTSDYVTNATLAFSRSDNITVGQVISGSGALTQMGPGMLSLTNANTLTGLANVTGGTLQIGNGGTTGSVDTSAGVNISSGATLAVNRSDDLTFGPRIFGNGNFVKTGPNTVTLQNINTMNTALVAQGKVIADDQSLGTATVTVKAGATLQVGFAATVTPGLGAQFFGADITLANTAMASQSTWNTYYTGQMTTAPYLSTTTLTASTAHARLWYPTDSSTHFVDMGFSLSNPLVPPGTDVNNNYGLNLQGEILIKQGGTYHFGLNSDDGSALWVDGQQIVLNNLPQGMNNGNTYPNNGENDPSAFTNNGAGIINPGSIYLAPGLHDIQVSYVEGGGGHGMNVSYNGPDTVNDTGAPFGTNPGNPSQPTLGNVNGWVFIPNSVLSDVVKSTTAYGLSVGALTGAGQVDLFSGVLTVGTNNSNSAFAGTIFDSVGGGSLVKTGSGTFTLTGTSTYTGQTVVNMGTLQLGDGLSNATDPVLATSGITTNASLVYNVFGTQTANYPIDGTGTLFKTGTGTLTLNASNTYSGATTVNAGKLVLGTNSQLAAATPVTVNNNATLALVGGAQLLSSNIMIQPGGLLDATAATPGFSLGAGQTLSAGRSGPPANDLVGNITLDGGVVNIGIGVGTIATLTAGNGAFGLSGGTVNFDLTSVSTTSGGTNDVMDVKSLSITSPTALVVNAVNASLSNGVYPLINFSGALTGGTSNLQIEFPNLATNGTRQTFKLETTGTSNAMVELVVGGNPANLIWTGSVSTAWDLIHTKNWNNAGTADFFYNNDFVTFNDTAATGNVVVAQKMSPGGITFNNNALTYILSGSGSLMGATGLTVSGNGTVVLANTNGNQFTGPTTINSGMLVLGNANAVQSSSVNVIGNNGLGFSSGIGTFNLVSLNGPGALVLSDTGGGAVTVAIGASGANSSYSGAISGNGGFTKLGGGTLYLSGNNSYSGLTTINAGAVQLGSANAMQGSTVNLNVDNGLTFGAGVGTFNVGGLSSSNLLSLVDTSLAAVTMAVGGNGQSTTFNGTMIGAGGIVKTGSGTLTFTGTNIAYTGNTTVSAGTLRLQDTVAFTQSAAAPFATGFSAGTGPANTLSVASGATLEFNINAAVNGTFDNAESAVGVFGGTTVTGQGTFLKTGTGVLSLGGQGTNASNVLTMAMGPNGLIDIEGGMLRNGGWAAANWAKNQASMNIAAGAYLDLWDGNPTTNDGAGTTGSYVFVNALTGAGTVTKQQGTNQVFMNVGVAGGSGTFSGIIENPQTSMFGNNTVGSQVSLSKSGSGTQVLTGSNTYTGSTVVLGGVLQVGNGGAGASIASTSGVIVGTNASVVFNHSDAVTMTTPIIGGNFVKTGAGILNLTGNNSLMGPSTATISQGTVQANDTNFNGSAVTVAAGGKLIVGAASTTNPGLIGTYYNGVDPYASGALTGVGNNWVTYRTSQASMLGWYYSQTVGASADTSAWSNGTLDNADNIASCAEFPAGYAGSGNQFDALFQGTITIAASGTYNFQTQSDDASGIYIDGKLVVDNFYSQGVTSRQGSITLSAGPHAIAIAYGQTGGGLGFAADWGGTPGSTTYVGIPNSVLSYQTAGGAGNALGVGSLSGNGTVDLNSGALSVGSNGANSTFAGSIIDSVGGGSLVKTGVGTLTLSGSSNFANDQTVVNSGTLIATSPHALGLNSGLTVANSSSFAYRPTTPGALTLGSGVLTLQDGSVIGTALGGTLSQSAITSTGAASLSGNITLDIWGIIGHTPAVGVNKLITAASGLDGGSVTLGYVYNAFNFTVSGLTESPTAISVTVAAAVAPANLYWLGGFGAGNNVWGISDGQTSSNWTLNADGSGPTPLVPGPNTTVNFSAAGATNQGATVLGVDMSVAGLVVSDTASVALGPDGHMLTIGSGGVSVLPGAGSVNLGAAIIMGAAQSWTNNAANTLTISGPLTNGGNLLTIGGSGNTLVTAAISGNGGLTKTGASTLLIAAAQNYGGATNINGGTLKLGNAVTGFGGNGAGWTLNGAPTVVSDVLTLTFNLGNEARSAFYNTQVPTTAPFTANFTYQDVQGGGADGSALVFQTQGANALGGGGGALAYNGITGNSAAFEINVYNGHTVGTNLATNGTTGNYNATGAVNVASGDPIQVNLSYDGSTTLLETLTDLKTNATFNTSYTGVNLASVIGAGTAYMGFTGADGGAECTQTISNFSLIFGGGSNILPVGTHVNISNGSTLDLTKVAQTIASLSSTDGLGSKVLLDGGQLTVGDNVTNTTFDGTISGVGGSLIKQGAGSLVLTGTNTYNGGTTVLAGTLVLENVAAIEDGTNLSVGAGLAAFAAAPAAVGQAAPAASGVSAVPEPGTLVLLVVALCGAGLYRMRSRRKE